MSSVDDYSTSPSKQSNPLRDLYPSGKSRLTYPIGIEETNHFAMFYLSEDLKYDRKDITEKEAQGTVILPLPASLNTSYKADYGTEDLGILGLAGAEFGTAASGNSGEGFINSIVNSVKGIESGSGAALNLGLAFAGSEIGNIVSGGAVNGALYGAKVARNQHQAVMFNNVGFRSHAFTYNLVPKNFEEQKAINNIIFMFKSAMLPTYVKGNHFFKYPAKFDIKLTTDSTYLFDIAASVLTSFDVEYHGQSGDFYHDIEGSKAPVSVTINMNFLETSITTREDVAKGGMGGKGNR